MQIRETWSISAERIRTFYLSQSDVLKKADDRFFCGECEILLTPLPLRKVGPFGFPQTQVEFRGPEEAAEALRRRFVMQFISAGA